MEHELSRGMRRRTELESAVAKAYVSPLGTKELVEQGQNQALHSSHPRPPSFLCVYTQRMKDRPIFKTD